MWHAPFRRGDGRPVDAGREHRRSVPGRACHPSTHHKKGMAMTIVEAARPVTGGVDTHLDVHVAAALDPVGGLLGVESFPASGAGYRQLLAWLASFGPV